MAGEHEWYVDVGDHRLVTIPDALTTVVFTPASKSNSSSDTATNKYFDNMSKTAKQFNLVADKDIQLVGLNGETFTEAVPINGNAVWQESRGRINSVTIKTTAATTVISLRVRS